MKDCKIPHLRVDPMFRIKIKKEAAERNLTILEYTRQLAGKEEQNQIQTMQQKKSKLWDMIL